MSIENISSVARGLKLSLDEGLEKLLGCRELLPVPHRGKAVSVKAGEMGDCLSSSSQLMDL